MKIDKFFDSNRKEILDKAVVVLRLGGLVIFPSDTVYVAMVDATNEDAVKKLLEFKNRPAGKPISVFVVNLKMLKENIIVNENQDELLTQLLPGPFTVVLPSRHKTSLLLESEKGTLGVRLVNYDLINQLIESFKKPVTATSANLSGRSPHYSIEVLLKSLPESKKRLIDFVVDVGKIPFNKPSTIIDLSSGKFKLVRQGDLVFKNTKTFISKSPSQTKKIAQFIFEKAAAKIDQKSLILIIEGELGVGKTIFVKGIGEQLKIDDIISPTFVIYYEYPLRNPSFKNFYHFDLYHLEGGEEFKYLGIKKILSEKNILCFEWGERAGEILNILKKNSKIIYVKMRYINEKEREIEVNY